MLSVIITKVTATTPPVLVTRLLAIRLLATHGYCVEYDYWLFTVIALNTVIALDTVIVLHDYCMVEYIYIYICIYMYVYIYICAYLKSQYIQKDIYY